MAKDSGTKSVDSALKGFLSSREGGTIYSNGKKQIVKKMKSESKKEMAENSASNVSLSKLRKMGRKGSMGY